MGNSLHPFTYKADLSLDVGFCLSRITFQQLKEDPTSFLHPTEETRYRGLSHPRRQHSYLLGRYCAKQAIMACHNNINERKIAIQAGVFDQPVVVSGPHPSFQVSISHTDSLGTALAFPEIHPMAIDVETICPSKREAIKSQLTLTEQKLGAFLQYDEATQLTLLWTVKEALSKALRCGLTVPFEILEVDTLRKEKKDFVISTFKNFKQYHALSFCLGESVCSIVHPLSTSFDIDIDGIQRSLQG